MADVLSTVLSELNELHTNLDSCNTDPWLAYDYVLASISSVILRTEIIILQINITHQR